MNSKTELTQLEYFTVMLPLKAHQLAQNLCKQQTLPKRVKQVYLNTLAVYSVNYYLKCMGLDSDLEKSESQDILAIQFADVADLEIKDIGKLECRPVLPNAEFVHIPQEVWDSRIGYIAVQLSESLQEATLLGFVKTATTEELPLNQLHSLEEFLDYIETLGSNPLIETVSDVLKRIFNTLESSWQTVESLIGTKTPILAEELTGYRQIRSNIVSKPEQGFIRANLINDIYNQQVALIIALMPATQPDEIDVLLEVRPTPESKNLPHDLQLMVLDQSGIVVLYAQPQEHDPIIQFEFSVKLQESFTIKLILGDTNYTKEFLF